MKHERAPWPEGAATLQEELDALGPVQGGVRAVQRAPDAADALTAMAATFRERNAGYKNNYRMVGPIMATLFPQGVPVALLGSDQWHLFELIIVKLTRFAISELKHGDSIEDVGVYAAMINAVLSQQETKEQS